MKPTSSQSKKPGQLGKAMAQNVVSPKGKIENLLGRHENLSKIENQSVSSFNSKPGTFNMKANLQQSGKPPLKQQNGANLQIPSKGVKNNQIDVAFVGARKNSKQQSPGLAKDTDNIFQSANDTVRGDAEDVVKKNKTVDVSLGTHKNGKNQKTIDPADISINEQMINEVSGFDEDEQVENDPELESKIMVEQQLEELSNRIKKDSKSNTGSRLPDKSHYSDLESFTLDMGGLAIESEKQPMVEKDKKGTPPDESKNLEMTEEQIQELMKKKKQTEYLTDFKDPEVNNYWRFKKLEEQEQNSDDPGADEQEELDKDSEDSQTQRDKNAADELMLLLGKKKEKTTKFGDQDQPGEKKIRKQKTKTLTKQATALDSFRKLNPEQQKEALKKKRDEDERIRRMTSLSDFRDSQIQYRNYMDHRKRFNTHEDQQEKRRKQFEPAEGLDQDDEKNVESLLQKFIQDKFKSNDSKKEDGDEDEDNEQQKDDDEKEDDDDNDKEELPKLDFKKMLKSDKRQKTLTLPFTNTQVEDVIFLKPWKETLTDTNSDKKKPQTKVVEHQEIISLQCNFFQQDCYYYNMVENKNPKNRMATENYEVADWDMALKKSSFEKVHKNLVIDKTQSYTNKMKENQMMHTENRESMVEYFLTKWRINAQGGMKMILQSEYFKMDGTFKEHERDVMELQLNEDGSYIFITQNDKSNILPLKIKVWDVINLQEQVECVEDFDKKLDDLKEKQLNRLDLIVDNTYLAVTYYDKDYEDPDNYSSFLEKFQIISKEMLRNDSKRDDVFTFNPFFNKKEDEAYFWPQARWKVHDKANNDEFVFPMKIFLDSSNKKKKANPQMSDVKFKVLFLFNKTYKYTDQNGGEQVGYPWTLIEYNMQQLHDWTTIQIDKEDRLYCMNEMCKHAVNVFFSNFYQQLSSYDHEKEQPIDKIESTGQHKELKKYIDTLEGKIYFLPPDWVDWQEDWSKNPLIFSDIQVNLMLDQVSWNNKERREFLVYNKEFSCMKNVLCPMNSIKYTAQSQGVIDSIKNQKNKSHIRCVYKGLGTDTTIYCFFHEDIDNNLKVFKIQDDYEKADLDCDLIFKPADNDPDPTNKDKKFTKKFNKYQLGVITVKKFTQNIIYKICKPEERNQNMRQLQSRVSVGQVFNAQYPCLATNLGLTKICIQINLNKLNPKAMIYDWNENQDEQKKKEEREQTLDDGESSNNCSTSFSSINSKKDYEIFVGFVNYNQFADLALDERHICVDICSRFAYLTKKPSEDDHFEGKEQVYLNVLIVDAYNPIPQVVHFKSRKIFDFRTSDQFEDVIKENLIFKAGDEIHLMTQFPRAIHHAILTTDLTQDALDEDNHSHNMSAMMGSNIDKDEFYEKGVDMLAARDGQSDNQSLNSQQKKMLEGFKQAKDKHLLKAQKENLEKIRKALFQKLSGDIIPVTLFQDIDPQVQSVYFAMRSKEFENFIEVYSFDPTKDQKNTVKIILTLRKKNLLIFEQMKDGSFFIVDDQGIIGIYQFKGSMLERTDFLYMHPQDVQKVKKFGEFTRVIVDRDVMIAPRHVFYLFDSQENIVDGVLMSENLVDNIQSDYNYDCVDGPIRYRGQDAFINMYCYKDSQDEQVFFFRQIIYRKPNSAKKHLVNDFNRACDMSTFLESEDILCNFGSKFLQFTKDGIPRDELVFQGHPTQFLGESEYNYSDKVYLVAYWHQYKCEMDDGICKQIYILNTQDEEVLDKEDGGKHQLYISRLPAQASLRNRYSRNTVFKQAKIFFDKQTKTVSKEQDNVIIQMVENEEEQGEGIVKKKKEVVQEKKEKYKLTPGVLVLVDRNRGLCYLEHQAKGQYWHQKCVEKAIKQYHQRMELVSISDNSKYFLFCDTFLQTFSVWKHTDKSYEMVRNYLFTSTPKKKLGQVEQFKSYLTSKRNIINTKDYNTKSKPAVSKEKNYPEHEYPPQDLPEKSKKRYIKKFLRIVPLTSGVKMIPNKQTNSLANHQIGNLLTGNKTKFIAKDVHLDKKEEFFFHMTFQKPQQISAFGLRSANNYPHLDPSHIRIEVKLDDNQPDTHSDQKIKRSDSFLSNLFSTASRTDSDSLNAPDFKKCIEVDDLHFKFRSQLLYFIKPNPWEFVKEVKIYILKNKWTKVTEEIEIDQLMQQKKHSGIAEETLSFKKSLRKKEPLTFQLAQIEILEKKEFFDYQFIKVMDLVMWKQTPFEDKQMGHILKGEDLMTIFDDLEGKNTDDEEKGPQQESTYDFHEFDTFDRNIQKKIAFLRQDNVTKTIVIERAESQTTKGLRIDKKLKVIFGHCDHNLQRDNIKVLGSIFEMDLEEYFLQKQKCEQLNIQQPVKEIEPTTNFKKLIPYLDNEKQQELPSTKHYQKKIMRLREENEKFVLQQLALASYQRDLNTIYRNQEKIRKQIYKFSKLIQVKFSRNNFIIKRSQSVQYGLMEDLEKEGSDNFDIKKLQYKLPKASVESQTSIQNVYFTNDPNMIQILAIDFIKNLLIMATWDINHDYETNMIQIKNNSDDTDMADLVVLKGINNKKNKSQKAGSGATSTRIGGFNYMLNLDTFVDLENNIPFMYSDVNSEYDENDDFQMKKGQVSNVKKIFKDSTRFISPYERHHLVYSNTQRDIQLWEDVLKQPNRKAAIRASMNVLEAFRIQFQGMSLFHHFANDQQIIKFIHQEYTTAKEQDLFESESVKDMPLFILCPDDQQQMVAMQLAIKHQKPTNFEYMVSMLKDFSHICSSKMMLSNFNEMMTLGFGQILEYFDKSQFNPPMLSTPFVIEWPDSLQEFPFTSHTSLISEQILQDQVDKQINTWNSVYLFINHYAQFREQKKKDKFQLVVENDGIKTVKRRIQVQALDFDWIFDGNNAESFLKLLELKGTDELFNQKSIQLFIQLMWDKYKVSLISGPLLQYMANLVALILLTSIADISYIDHLPICNDLSEETWTKKFNWTFGVKGDVCETQATDDKLYNLYWLNSFLCFITLIFVGINFKREIMQILIIGSPIDYINSMWNCFDMTQAICEAVYLGLMFDVLLHKKEHESGITLRHLKHMRTFGAWVIFMKWMKFFYWGKLYKTSAYFIVQLYETVREMGGFMILLVMCIIAFTNFFMVIQKNKDPEQLDEFGVNEHPDYVTSFVDSEFFASLISVYLLSLGDFQQLAGYSEGHDRQFAWLMFILGTIIIQLIFMNMLIAVMSTPFSIVKEKETLFRYKQQLSIIVDYIDHVPIKNMFKDQKYILVVKPEEITVDDGGSEKDIIIDQIRETLRGLRKNHNRQFDILKDLMEKQISSSKIEKDENEVGAQK